MLIKSSINPKEGSKGETVLGEKEIKWQMINLNSIIQFTITLNENGINF